MTAASNRPGLPQLPSEFLAFTPTTRAAITRYAMRAVDEALAALTGVPAWELRLQGAEAFAEVYGAQDDWRTEAAAWLRRKADEQERTNREFPKHVEAYPSWTDRPRQFRWLADDLDAESKLAARTPSPATSAQGADAQAAERAALATQPPAPVLQTEAAGEASESADEQRCEKLRALGWQAIVCGVCGHDGAVAYPRAALTPPAPALPPVARVPLTEEQLFEIHDELYTSPLAGAPDHARQQMMAITRAVEKAHGIEASTGEQSHG